MADPFEDLERAIERRYNNNESALDRWHQDEPYIHALYDIWTGETNSGGEWRARAMGEFWDQMARYGVEKYDGTFDWKKWKQEYESNVGSS